MTNAKKIVMITGGGTGGHIYPGVAVARAILAKHADIEIHFVGATRGLESKIIPRENFILHKLSIGALNAVSLQEKIKTLLQMPWALMKSACLLIRYRPLAVLGVGGYASGPFLLMASLLSPFFKMKTALWEGNAYPGMVNRFLARLVDRCFLVFEDSQKFLISKSFEVAGLPVRGSMSPKERAEHSSLRVLVFGGSQGARGINQVVTRTLLSELQKYPKFLGSVLEKVELIHQTGRLDFEEIKKSYEKMPSHIQVFEFLYDMNERMNWADLVICRAGASSIAELAACAKACVLIPLPTAADNHQQKNAEAVVQVGGGRMILQKDLTETVFLNLLKEFYENKTLIKNYEMNIKKLDKPYSAEKIAEFLCD